MRTINKSDLGGFSNSDAAIHQAIWLLAPPARRPVRNRSHSTGESRKSEDANSGTFTQASHTSEFLDDNLPFSALIRLVRQMRE